MVHNTHNLPTQQQALLDMKPAEQNHEQVTSPTNTNPLSKTARHDHFQQELFGYVGATQLPAT